MDCYNAKLLQQLTYDTMQYSQLAWTVNCTRNKQITHHQHHCHFSGAKLSLSILQASILVPSSFAVIDTGVYLKQAGSKCNLLFLDYEVDKQKGQRGAFEAQ